MSQPRSQPPSPPPTERPARGSVDTPAAPPARPRGGLQPLIPWVWARLTVAVLLAVVVGVVHRFSIGWVEGTPSLTLFALLAVIASAWLGRFLSGLLTLLLSTGILMDAVSVPPGSFRLASMNEVRLVLLFFVAGALICLLIEALHTGKRAGEALARERRALADSLLVERQRMASLLSNLPGIVWEARVDGASGAARPSFVSSNCARLLGRSASELVDQPLAAAIGEPDATELEAALAEVAAGGAARSVRHRWPRADGEERWFETHLARRGEERERVHCVSLDVTEAQEVERRLARSEARFREAADRAPVMLWIAEADDGFVWANRAWFDFRGRSLAEERGLGWVEGVDPRDAASLSTAAVAAFERGEEFRLEFRIRRADGAWRWLLAIGVPRFTPDGDVQDFLVFSVDLSERKQVEMERESLLEGSERARRLAEVATQSKDEFLAKVSHELRNPLNGILGWTQILKRDDAGEDDFRRGIDLIDSGARALVQLVDDLLDVSRITAGKTRLTLAPTDLKRTIETACRTAVPSATAKGVNVRFELDDGIPPVMGDARRLQQVAWNLLANAVKFTPRGGAIDVRLRAEDGDAVFSVADSGIGIDPEFLPQVFAPFTQQESTSTRRYRGLGLGLAISRHLIELHGGSIEAASDGPDKGSTFEVRLPLGSPEDAVVADAPTAGDAAAGGELLSGLRILVVDDDPTARELLPRLLSRAGARVDVAASAEEGLSSLLSFRPEVLVSDIEMPGTDGFAFLRRVRALADEEGGTTPAIALTAYVREEERRRILLAGFQEHLGKPVQAEQLVAAIANLAGRTVAASPVRGD